MLFISAYPIIKKNLFVKTSYKDIQNNLFYLKNIEHEELSDIYTTMKNKLAINIVSLNESKEVWDSYRSEIIIFFCIRKVLLNQDIPFVTGLDLPFSNPY